MKDRIKKSALLEIITDTVIVWLPIDLLYLYSARGWNETNVIILYAELLLLFLLPIFGIWRLYKFIKFHASRAGILQAEPAGTRLDEYDAERARCPLKLACFTSCHWWQNDKCAMLLKMA